MVDKAAAIRRIIEKFAPEEQKLLLDRLERVLIRQRAIARFPTPGHLAQFWHPSYVQTPMLDAIDNALIHAALGLRTRWIINTPPQRGKTKRLQAGVAWMLLRDPTLNAWFASYEQGIAGQSSLAIRQFLEQHGSGYRGAREDPLRVDSLGLMLDPDRAMQTRWGLADVPGVSGVTPGGVGAVGVGGALTGRPADCIIVDDPVKDKRQADSPTFQKNVIEWFESVVLTRLSKRAIVVVLQTRWHEKDLSGWLLENHNADGRWEHLNVKAQAEKDDPLGREPGEYLVDARGFVAEDWERVKQEVGTRTWFALYQGDPSPPEGGTFKRAWFDHGRVPTVPELSATMVFVDPADNAGDGDEAGIVTGGLGADGYLYVLADDSGHYTVGGWFRAALYALLRNDATRICYERSLSGLRRSMRTEWRSMHIQARELAREPRWSAEGPADPDVIAAVVDRLADEDDDPAHRAGLQRQLIDMWPWAGRILALPETGPTIKGVTATGTKTFRAEMVAPLYENGTARHVGEHPQLERQMATWLVGQDSPDRMDAAVHLLSELNGHRRTATPIGRADVALPERRAARAQIARSVSSRR